MSIFNTMNISASGLTAQRLRLDVISENIANVNTTRTSNGGPYRRKEVILSPREGNTFRSFLQNSLISRENRKGVKVTRIVEDQSPFVEVYNPNHPDADENGIVRMPNVEIVREMVDMISASRAYEANITAFNNTKSMALKSLEIGR